VFITGLPGALAIVLGSVVVLKVGDVAGRAWSSPSGGCSV
jgi:hypothetical protein